MSYKDRPFYKAKYQMELAYELTDKKPHLIRLMMRRKGWTLAETVKYYLKKHRN